MGSLHEDGFSPGADATVLSTYDSNWVLPYGGDLVLKSGAVATSTTSTCAARYDGGSFPADQYVQGTVIAAASGAWAICVRHITSTGPITAYMAGCNPNEFGHSRYAIWKYLTSAFTHGGAHASAVVTAGDIVRLKVETSGSDAALSLYVNDMVTPIHTWTDTASPLASGRPAIFMFHNAANVALLDDFDAGDITTGPSPLVGAGVLTGIASRMDLGLVTRTTIRG